MVDSGVLRPVEQVHLLLKYKMLKGWSHSSYSIFCATKYKPGHGYSEVRPTEFNMHVQDCSFIMNRGSEK